ncbi:MAG: hypothetical protein U1F57_08245 [bacterium]
MNPNLQYIRDNFGWRTAILVALFVGFMAATAGLALFPAVGKVAGPFLCVGELQVQSSHYHPSPGQYATTRHFFCPDGREVSWKTSFVCLLVYSAASFAVLALGVLLFRRR